MDDIRLEADISLENGNVNRQVNRRRNERGLGEIKLIINKMPDMMLGKQQIIRTQMRRAWLGELKIIVAEMKEIGSGEMKLIIHKMLEMLLDTKECIVWQEVILFQVISI